MNEPLRLRTQQGMADILAIASVIGIAGAGAKLSIALFDFASTVGSAATEITAIGIEVSQFCVVVKQVESALTKARKTVRYSNTALLAIQQITNQCQPVIEKIEEILKDLQKDKAQPNFLGRLKWTLKRPKVQMLQKTLEASKLTLSCLLMTLLFAENVSSRSTTTIETQTEDENQKVVTQSLLVARQCAVNELETLEDSLPLEGLESELPPFWENMAEPPSLGPIPRVMRSPNRHSRIMDGALVPSFAMSGDTNDKRSSILLNEVMPGDIVNRRRLTWEDALSSSYIRAQPVHLLQQWTEQGDRLSKLVTDNDLASLQEHNDGYYSQKENHATRLGAISDVEERNNLTAHQSFNTQSGLSVRLKQRQLPYSHSRSKSEPSTTESYRDPLRDPVSPFTENYDEKKDSAASYSSEAVEIFKSFRVSLDDPCVKILPEALKKYKIQAGWREYDLYVVYGDQERRLQLHEKPLILFKQLDKEGKKPVFMLRKRALNVDGSSLPRVETPSNAASSLYSPIQPQVHVPPFTADTATIQKEPTSQPIRAPPEPALSGEESTQSQEEDERRSQPTMFIAPQIYRPSRPTEIQSRLDAVAYWITTINQSD